MEYLSGWLLFVATLRLLAVVMDRGPLRHIIEQLHTPHPYAVNPLSLTASLLCSSPLCLLWRCAVLGYLDKKYFQQQVFRAATHEVSALAARLFSAWCSITCALCLVLSQNLDNRALFVVTFFSFAVALAFFSLELVVYRSVDIRGVWMQAFIATTSLVLMYMHMDKQGLHRFTRLQF